MADTSGRGAGSVVWTWVSGCQLEGGSRGLGTERPQSWGGKCPRGEFESEPLQEPPSCAGSGRWDAALCLLGSVGAGPEDEFESLLRSFHPGRSLASDLTSLCLAFLPGETWLMTPPTSVRFRAVPRY